MRTSTGTATRAACLLLVVLLTGGCQARLTVGLDVDRNGAGRLTIALGADAALLAEAEAAGVDPLGDLAATGTRLQAEGGWRVTDIADTAEDAGRTVSLSAPFASAEELERLADEVADALAGPELVPLEDVRLAVEEDVLRLSGVAGLVPTEAVTGLGVQPQQAVQILTDTRALLYEIRVDLAGDVIETNATSAGEGQSLVWRVDPGERIAMVAVTERPPPAWWPLAAAAVLAGILVVGLLAFARGAGRRGLRAEDPRTQDLR